MTSNNIYIDTHTGKIMYEKQQYARKKIISLYYYLTIIPPSQTLSLPLPRVYIYKVYLHALSGVLSILLEPTDSLNDEFQLTPVTVFAFWYQTTSFLEEDTDLLPE